MDGNLPLVSVGIPTYNRPEGLRRALDCITKQTYTNLEIIISDNCSDDAEMATVINEFSAKDKRIVSIRQTENIGAANNFNFVLTQATGEFFMWAADDDEWDEGYVNFLLDIHMRNDYCLVASTPRFVAFEGESQYLEIPKEMYNGRKATDFLEFVWYHHWYYAKATAVYGIYKRDVLNKAVSILEKIHISIGPDIMLLNKVLSFGKIFVSKEKLWVYNRRAAHLPSKMHEVSLKKILQYFYLTIFGKTNKMIYMRQYTDEINVIIDESQWNLFQKVFSKVVNYLNEIRVLCVIGFY